MQGLRKKFAKKGAELLEANERAFAGRHRLRRPRTRCAASRLIGDRRRSPAVKLLTDGNDMCAAAAIFCRLPVLRRVSDHAVHRGDAVPHPRDLEVRRRGPAGRGRDRRRRRRARRVVRGQEVDDRHLRARACRSRPRCSASPASPSCRWSSSTCSAAVRPPACRPSPSSPISSRRRSRRTATCVRPVLAPTSVERHLRRHRRGLQPRRAVPDAGDPPLRPGDRAAQGDRRPDRHLALRDRRSPPADREGAGAADTSASQLTEAASARSATPG